MFGARPLLRDAGHHEGGKGIAQTGAKKYAAKTASRAAVF
jgi:hypothetical protein